MVATPLVEQNIAEGQALLQQLDRDRFGVSAAFWYYESEPDRWSLVIATPRVGAKGLLKASRQLIRSMRKLAAASEGSFTLDSASVRLVKEDDELPRLLRRALPTGRQASGIRLTGSGIGGRLIEDAYIYRMERPLAA